MEGTQWITAKHPDANYRKPYLVDNVELGRAFRKRYINGVRRLVRQGKLKLDGELSALKDPAKLKRWCTELKRTDWNVFIEGPPHGQSKPEHVLQYLTRYLSGGPIQDGRIISELDGWIHFWARSKDKLSGNRMQPVKLRGAEFVRRWAMHILPKGFMRSRRYGGYHTTQSRAYLQQCRERLGSESADSTQAERFDTVPDRGKSLINTGQPECPHCGVPLECTSQTRRPSWKQVFDVGVYRDTATYCPLLHVFQRGPPESG